MLQIKRQDNTEVEPYDLWHEINETAEPDMGDAQKVGIFVYGDQFALMGQLWDGTLLGPHFLDPELYSVTDTDSLPRSEVRRVLEERQTLNRKLLRQAEADNIKSIVQQAVYGGYEDREIAKALSIPLSQKGAEASKQSQLEGEAK